MAKIKWERAPESIIWNKIKSLRKERGIKQVELAIGTGLSVTWIQLAEQGNRISDDAQRKIAAFFDVEVDDIFPAQMQGNKPWVPRQVKKEGSLVHAKVQMFQPKHLKRMLEHAPKVPGVHPTPKDIKDMAGDTIKLASMFIPDEAKREKQIKGARKTIANVRRAEKK